MLDLCWWTRKWGQILVWYVKCCTQSPRCPGEGYSPPQSKLHVYIWRQRLALILCFNKDNQVQLILNCSLLHILFTIHCLWTHANYTFSCSKRFAPPSYWLLLVGNIAPILHFVPRWSFCIWATALSVSLIIQRSSEITHITAAFQMHIKAKTSWWRHQNPPIALNKYSKFTFIKSSLSIKINTCLQRKLSFFKYLLDYRDYTHLKKETFYNTHLLQIIYTALTKTEQSKGRRPDF